MKSVLTDHRFPRAHRLRRRPEFLHVQRSGQRVHTRHFLLVIWPRADGDSTTRLGVTVTKRVAGSVGRNRVKRILRDVFRRHRHYFPDGCDLVIIAKSNAPELGCDEVRRELARIRRPLEAAAKRAAQKRDAQKRDERE